MATALAVAHEEVRREEEAESFVAGLKGEEAILGVDVHEEVLERVLLVGGGDAEPVVLAGAGVGAAADDVAAMAVLAMASFLLLDEGQRLVLHAMEVRLGFGDGFRDGHGRHVHASKQTRGGWVLVFNGSWF